MKRNFKIAVSLIALTATVAVSLLLHSCTLTKINERNRYNINAETDGINLTGELILEVNKSEDKDLYFCLYPNAFKDEENIENTSFDREKAYPAGFDSGYTDVLNVECNGKKCKFSVEENGQILKAETNKSGKRKIKISFSEKLPHSPARFGYGENTYNYGNWYPVLCPNINGETVKNTYTAKGDPFCSETADYSVSVTAPATMRIASTGKIISRDETDPFKHKWNIQAENVRDFAFAVSENYKLISRKTGDTVVYSYYYGDEKYAQKALESAVSAIECYSSLFGKYPYDTFSVAQTDFYMGGMEYPNLVFINGELYCEEKEETLEEVTVHETAHQWWYGIVGNDEKKEPWLDEGLTQYSVALYFEEKYGGEKYGEYIKNCNGYCELVFGINQRITGECDRRIGRASDEFENILLYDALVYDASAVMFDAVRGTVGREKLITGMKKYFEDCAYTVADGKKFFTSFSSATGKNGEELFLPWLNGEVYW